MLGKKKTMTSKAQPNKKHCQLGNVTLGCGSAFPSFTSSSIVLRTLFQEEIWDTSPFNIMSWKMMKVLGGSCTSTFSIHDPQTLVLVLMVHEPAVQHTAGELQAPSWTTDTLGPTAPTWLAGLCPPGSRPIWLQVPSTCGHFMHSCYHPVRHGSAIF